MQKLLRRFGQALFTFSGLLALLFLCFDLGFFGSEVKINGLYYVFIGVLLATGAWFWKNAERFKDF